MVNILFWYVSSASVPSGWTEISSTYRDRLVCVSGTPLSTGGVSTHTHTLGTWTVGTASTSGVITTTAGVYAACNQSHTHSVSSSSVTAASSFPTAKAYRLIYKNYTNFTGLLEANIAVTKTSTPGTGWTEVDNGSSYYHYIGDSADVGMTYGGSHYHPVNVTLGSIACSSNPSGTGSRVFSHASHGHVDKQLSSGSASAYDFKRVGSTKLWKTTTTVYSLPANCYAYFDGTLPSGWTEITAATDHLHYKSTGTSFSSTAGSMALVYSHTHSISSQASGAPSATVSCATGSEAANAQNHTHALSVTLNSGDMAPPYVRFRMAYNTSEISAISTNEKTYTMDMLLSQTRTQTHQMDVILQARRSTSVTADILLKKGLPKTYEADIILQKARTQTYAMDALMNKTIKASIVADLHLKKTVGMNYDVSAVLQKTLTKAYSANVELVKPFRELSYEMGLSVATRRLTSIDMSALLQATKKAEASFDLITINRREAEYTLNMLLQAPRETSAQFDVLLQRTGTAPYTLDVVLQKSRESSYQLSAWLQALREKAYLMEFSSRLKRTATADFDATLIQRREAGYDLAATLQATRSINYTLSSLMQKRMASTVDMSARLQKSLTSNYTFDMLTQKHGLTLGYQMNTFIYQHSRVSVNMSMLARATLEANALFDVLVAGRYDKDYIANILLEKTEARTYTMDSLLQGVRETSIDVDLWLQKPQETTFDMDALIQRARTAAIYANVQLQKAISKDYSVNALIAGRREASYYADALLMGRREASYETDILLAGRQSQSYTVNAKIAKTRSKTYLSKLYLKRYGVLKTFDMSAYIVSKIKAVYNMQYSGAKSVNKGVNFDVEIIRPSGYDLKRDLPSKRVSKIYPEGTDYFHMKDIPEVEIKPFPVIEDPKPTPSGSEYDDAPLTAEAKVIEPFPESEELKPSSEGSAYDEASLPFREPQIRPFKTTI